MQVLLCCVMLLYVAVMMTMWAYCAHPDLVIVLCTALILGLVLLANFFGY